LLFSIRRLTLELWGLFGLGIKGSLLGSFTGSGVLSTERLGARIEDGLPGLDILNFTQYYIYLFNDNLSK
jgi:hypothetical protein